MIPLAHKLIKESTMKKLTDWYPEDTKPVRKGVYEKDFATNNPHEYQYWDGKRWFYGSYTPEKTFEKYYRLKNDLCTPYRRKWRGLTKSAK